MRTFEEYVAESINFRLGGSKNANTPVTFRELKPGNRFYVYFVLKKTGKVAGTPAPEIHKLKRMYDTNSPTNLKFFCLLSDVDGKEKDYNIKASDLDSTTSVYEYINLIRVTSTTELTNEEAEEIARQSLEESVDFRLGGSANKGEVDEKKFSELEPGDDVYFFKFADGKLEEEASYKFKSTKSFRRGSSELAFDDPYTFLILTKEEMEESIKVSETSDIIDVTTTYKISAEEALEAAKQKLEESVDFRLGGKARKGMEDGRATALYYHELPSEDDWEVGAFKESLEHIKEEMYISEVTTEDVYDFYDTCKDVEFKWVNQAWKDADLEYEMDRGGCILRIAKLDGKRIEEIVNENKDGEDEIFIIAVIKY